MQKAKDPNSSELGLSTGQNQSFFTESSVLYATVFNKDRIEIPNKGKKTGNPARTRT